MIKLYVFPYSKQLFTAVHNFIHLNLSIALFVGYLTFALGLELANHEKVCVYRISLSYKPSSGHLDKYLFGILAAASMPI